MGVKRFLSILVPLVAVVGVSCARPSGNGSGRVDHPTGAEDVVLSTYTSGAPVPRVEQLGEMPEFTLYGNGLMIARGPQIAVEPPPALPALVVRELTEDAMQVILRAARDAGLLGDIPTLEILMVTDAATTTFTVAAQGKRHQTPVYGLLDFEPDGEFVPDDQREIRRTLIEFRSKLFDLDNWMPAGSVSADRIYEPETMRIYSFPYEVDGFEPELVSPEPFPWPLATPLEEFGEPMTNIPDIRCSTLAGVELDTMLDAAAQANVTTPWQSGGRLFGVAFRPLLPGETGCPVSFHRGPSP